VPRLRDGTHSVVVESFVLVPGDYPSRVEAFDDVDGRPPLVTAAVGGFGEILVYTVP